MAYGEKGRLVMLMHVVIGIWLVVVGVIPVGIGTIRRRVGPMTGRRLRSITRR